MVKNSKKFSREKFDALPKADRDQLIRLIFDPKEKGRVFMKSKDNKVENDKKCQACGHRLTTSKEKWDDTIMSWAYQRTIKDHLTKIKVRRSSDESQVRLKRPCDVFTEDDDALVLQPPLGKIPIFGPKKIRYIECNRNPVVPTLSDTVFNLADVDVNAAELADIDEVQLNTPSEEVNDLIAEVNAFNGDDVNNLTEKEINVASNDEATAQNESEANISRRDKLFETLKSLQYFSQQVQRRLDQSGVSLSLQNDRSFLTSTQYGEDPEHPQSSPETGSESPQGSSNASKLTQEGQDNSEMVISPFLTSTQYREDLQHLQTSPETGSKSPESPQGSSNASTPEESHSTHKSLIEGQDNLMAISPPSFEVTDESILRNETGQVSATWQPRFSMKNDGSLLTSTQYEKDHHHLQTSPETGSESPQGSSNASKWTPEGSHSTPKSPIEGQDNEMAISPSCAVELTADNETGQDSGTWQPRYYLSTIDEESSKENTKELRRDNSSLNNSLAISEEITSPSRFISRQKMTRRTEASAEEMVQESVQNGGDLEHLWIPKPESPVSSSVEVCQLADDAK
jgi:hypothetical protein